MKMPIPSNGTEPLKVGDRVQIVPEWQDPGDKAFARFVIEAPEDSTRVLIQTLIPGFTIQPTEWIESSRLVLVSAAADPSADAANLFTTNTKHQFKHNDQTKI